MPVPSTVDAIGRSLLRETIYERLREAITQGTITPGERLRDDELSTWLGASRTPIREALARLEQDGLVESAPNRFTRVAIASSVEAREAHVVVAALHALAARLAAGSGAAADAERLREQSDRYDWALWRSDTAEAITADDALHRLILERAGNHHLHQLLERLMTRVRWMEVQSWPTLALADRASSQAHERLLRAVAGQNGELAAQAAREEWLNLGELVENALAQAEWRSRLEISD